MVFEEFGFPSLYCCPAPLLALHHAKGNASHAPSGCGLVLDAGFSFTHAVPVFDNAVLESGTRRLNLGGKLMTNYLKELVSYRYMQSPVCTAQTHQSKSQACAANSKQPVKQPASSAAGVSI